MEIEKKLEGGRLELDARHDYIFDITAACFSIDKIEVQEQMLQSGQVLLASELMHPDGCGKLIIVGREVPADDGNKTPMSGDSRDRDVEQESQTTLQLKVFEGKYDDFVSSSVFFIRCCQNVPAITEETVCSTVMFGFLEAENKESGYNLVLLACGRYLQKVLLPALMAMPEENWGHLKKFKDDHRIKRVFLGAVHALSENLIASQTALIAAKKLLPTDYSVQPLGSCDVVVGSLEYWLKHLETVINESEQVRMDSDEAGPRTELFFWTARSAKFNFLLERLSAMNMTSASASSSSSSTKHQAQLLKNWKRLLARLTELYHEAVENSQFLTTLDKHCNPLYIGDMVSVYESLGEAMGCLRIIHQISQYYQQADKMASLLVKVTNQVIIACKSHIIGRLESVPVWNQPLSDIAKKLEDSLALAASYLKHFRSARESLKNTSGPKFDFSEVQAFGKLHLTTERYTKLLRFIRTVEYYTKIYDTHVEEIMDPKDKELKQLAGRFQEAVASSQKKMRDCLNYRNKDIDRELEEFDEFVRQMQLVPLLVRHLSECWSTRQATAIVKHLEHLSLPNWNSGLARTKLLQRLANAVDATASQYNERKENPPIGRGLPPLVGRVRWALSLIGVLEESVNDLQEALPKVLVDTPEALKVVRKYNKVAKVLFEYASVHVRAWNHKMEEKGSVVSAVRPLLRYPPGQRNLVVNFDRGIEVVLREGECISKMDFDVAAKVAEKVSHSAQFRRNKDSLQLLLSEYSRLRDGLRQELRLLFTPHVAQIERLLRPGLNLISWDSLNVTTFIEEAWAALEDIKTLVTRANSICKFRIEEMLESFNEVKLVDLENSNAQCLEDFLVTSTNVCGKAIEQIQSKNRAVEEAVNDLLDLLFGKKDLFAGESSAGEDSFASSDLDLEVPSPQDEEGPEQYSQGTSKCSRRRSVDTRRRSFHARRQMRDNGRELLKHFATRCSEAIIKLVCKHLEALGRKLLDKGTSNGLFLVTAKLNIPDVDLSPSLKDIQKALTKVIHAIVTVFKGVSLWSRRKNGKRLPDEEPQELLECSITGKTSSFKHTLHRPPSFQVPVQLRNFYKHVSEHREVVQLSIRVTASAIDSLAEETRKALARYLAHENLWKKDMNTELESFKAKKPHVADYEMAMVKYENIEKDIDKLPDFVHVGGLSICAESLKSRLSMEAKKWTDAFGHLCKDRYSKEMEALLALTADLNRRFSRQIRDLDDVRFVMAALRELRDKEVNAELTIEPIEECYAMLQRRQFPVPREEVERVDCLRYTWQKLLSQSSDVQDLLLEVQPHFHKDLLENVKVFGTDCQVFYDDYDTNGPLAPDLPPRESYDRLNAFQARLDGLWRRLGTLSSGEELFGLEQSEYPELVRIRKEVNLFQKLYRLYGDVATYVQQLYLTPWVEVDIESINNELLEYQNRCRKLPKMLKEWPAFFEVKKTIDDFNELCPLLELMANRAMKQRHWKRICDVTSHQFEVESEGYVLKSIVDAPLLQHKEDIEDICISAVKEKDIEAKLKAVTNEWDYQTLSFTTFKNRGELLLRGDTTAETVARMEDGLAVLGSLLNNRYNAPFRKKIQMWSSNLSSTSEVLDKWLLVQNLWVYLEAVFVGGDIANQLPKEAARFYNIDKSWQKLMQRAHEMTNVVNCCVGDDTLKQLLPHLEEQLELCQRSLSGYLEKKRYMFPRFFFVSDPALLEILGQSSDSHSIQNHLMSIFDNTKSVVFHEQDYDRIVAIASCEGEVIKLEKPVKAAGSVELWLYQLLKSAQSTLHSIIRSAAQAIQESNFRLLEFANSFPAQVGILGLQMHWTKDAEAAIMVSRHDRKQMLETNGRFLEMLNVLIEQTTCDLSKIERVKYETLITIHVHQRDIFDHLCRTGIRSLTDFEWLKQSRFYFKEDVDKMMVCITDVAFVYQNEFLGCTERLVITPLTDRAYITLAQALKMSMGGCSSGPAGTGKTETVKDMGKTLGKYVVLFNCSDQMDYRGLGRIFKGLAQSGSWGCFDEFNRIDLPVLSVAAQQIACILFCKKEHRKQFVFTDGDCVEMNPEFGFFITMNPGYAGRKELPENLKIQFRTVAMMVPDRQIIIRVKLASCGFLENITLARKFYVLYKLCEEQLSKQVHYDFGLRNILSVLRTLGAAKKLASQEDSETTIVMRVLRDMNLSKLVDEDEPLFMSLINDLFPNNVLDKVRYPGLEDAIRQQVTEAGLIYHEPWVLKLIQLYETQEVRHGIMTLGPSGSGKTSCIHILMKALTMCGQNHREMRMNPKSITASQMFGRLDVATNDWTDGIFSALWRKTQRLGKNEHVWIVLDGPVDAMWIENLNSVLDDNKTLTLANGDRIPMSPNCKIIFEPHNIDNASPATVSRNGMVYMSSSVLGWQPIFKSWLNKRPLHEVVILDQLVEETFPEVYQWSTQNLYYKMDVLECNVISQLTIILQGLLPEQPIPVDPEKTEEQDEEKEAVVVPEPLITDEHVRKLYLFALAWSIGAFLSNDDRERMDSFLRNMPQLSEDLPGEDIFSHMVSDKGEWRHWSTRITKYVYPETSTPDFNTILVPHVDFVRTDFLVNTVAKQGKGVLLMGAQGTAKTVILKAYLNKYNTEVQLGKTINFSAATTPLQFQKTMESLLEKRSAATYGPPGRRKLTLFIDDINLPSYNEWGDQVTNEIVRQTMEMKGFYSLEKPGEFTSIIDFQYVAAMMEPGGGHNNIPPRLKRQFCIFNCNLPSDESIDTIFGVIGGGHYCAKRGYTAEVMDLVRKLVPVTRILWQTAKAAMLPTPANFHYVFNLRDLSRIWQGMIGTLSNVVTDSGIMMALWKHECTRVFADRLTTVSDLEWFDGALRNVVKETLGIKYLKLVESTQYFVDFLRDAPEPTGEEGEDADLEQPKVYEPIESFDALRERLVMFQSQFNEMVRGSGMDLVFFTDAMIHLIKISRIIRSPGGHALLVGVGGSGKQSLTRLASFIAGYKTFQITLTRSYGIPNLLEDLKVLFRTTGIQGKGTTFIFTDQEIKEESFLEYLNSLLSSGMVPNLYSKEELGEIVTELTPIMKREHPRITPTADNVLDFFATRSQQNLHVVLCFSPVGEKFRSRALRFPALISGCTVDWFQPWPEDALVAVSQHVLSDFEVICTPEVKMELVKAMGAIQEGVSKYCIEYFQRFRRSSHVTPKSYLTFVCSYKNFYEQKRAEILHLTARMEGGLAKLDEASIAVAGLKVELDSMEAELAAASDRAEKVLQEVTDRALEAETIRNQVRLSTERAQVIVDEISADKAVAEAKLESARPALEEAEAALNTIKQAHIATVRKLGRPPHLIMRVMDCVLLLFSRKLQPVKEDPDLPCPKPSWSESLKMMSNTSFLQMLQTFPKDTINEETVELLAPYISMPDYDMETACRVCGDVAGLLSWTKAMVVFYGVNKEVLPLKANLAIQEARLRMATGELARIQDDLLGKEFELDQLKEMYEKAAESKQKLVEQTSMCRKKMSAATTLISGLGGEKLRWTEQSKAFREQLGRLVGDSLLATAFLSYAGPFNQEFRNCLLTAWTRELSERSIPFSASGNVVDMLVENAVVAEWTLQGLPSDELSIQNGVIVTRASCYPLMVDPQSQGKVWIRNREAKNELQITTLKHKYFRTHLEDSLSLGRPLLIEDLGEELDPVLDNLLEKNFIKSGSTLKVMLGDKECDVMPGFTLYLTTKLANPAFSPEVSAKTTLVDFAVTMQGLEDQLLGRVILSERSELEKERVRLVQDVMENKRRVKELEDNLLLRLTTTQGSLVEDEDLLDVLKHTKATAQDVSEKLATATETEAKINSAREHFRPVATRGSILYFLIVEMSSVNCMYQTSLRQFLTIFDNSLANSEPNPIIRERIVNVNKALTWAVYLYSVRGLYESHKFLFTLLLALKIDLFAGSITHDEFMVFIKGGASLDLRTVAPKPFPWILDVTWLNLVQLSKLPPFLDVLDQVVSREAEWRAWFGKEAPEDATIPGPYETQLSVFHKTLLIRSWCPDRTLSQAKKYVGASLSEEYANGTMLDLEGMWNESETRVPLICLLSTGSDPSTQIEGLAKKHAIPAKSVSMGQGQEVPARKLLSQCISQGGWLLLQNCHLSLPFCDELMDTILESDYIHPSFRLWITTEPHSQFSIGLLQMSIKFTNEPPQGIRAGLLRTYAYINQDVLDFTRLAHWQPLLFGVAFLHTIVQERRKFGALGWNAPYEFNQADLDASIRFVQNLLDDTDPKKGISWVTVSYMLSEVMYGGRVTDDFDKRLLRSMSETWFTEEILDKRFSFYLAYNMPNCTLQQQYLDYISTFPIRDTPEVLGLHPNADITYQINSARQILDTILSIQPKEGASQGSETRECAVRRMATDMLNKLPPDYVAHEVKEALARMGALLPMTIFLRLEVNRMQRVLALVRATLSDLQLAIDGTIVMSETLRDALDCIYDARVPTVWTKISWESSTLGFWYTELQERNAQFVGWLENGRPNCFWMTGFFNPQGFLTAMRQEVTRAHRGWALDTVILQSNVTRYTKDDITHPPSEGVYVHGLFLEGAGWDRRARRLIESKPKVLFEPLPVMHMYAVNTVGGKDPMAYECPIYKKPSRADGTYVGSVDLKSSVSPYHWVYRGVALLCDIK